MSDLTGVMRGAHPEVKGWNRIGIFRFLEQAERDAQPGEFPLLFLREDGRTQWLLALRPEDVEAFVSGYLENKGSA